MAIWFTWFSGDGQATSSSSVSMRVATLTSVATHGSTSRYTWEPPLTESSQPESTSRSGGENPVETPTTSNDGQTRPKKPEGDIFHAAAAGNWQDVSNFLQTGSQPTQRDPNGFTPLHHAAASGNIETIDLLLKYGKTGWFADDNVSPLHLASRYGHMAAVKQILAKFPELEQEQAIAPAALHKLKSSTKHRFDVSFADFFGKKVFTARELAAIYGHQSTVLAFPYSNHLDFCQALSCACLVGDFDMVMLLWNHHKAQPRRQLARCTVDQIAGFPAPPLHLAVASGNKHTVAFLLEEGLNVNAQSKYSSETHCPHSPPAHYAATVGSVQLLKKLEHKGADITALDGALRTPLSYAVESMNVDMVEYLVQKKHPDRGMAPFGSRIHNQWLGSGHATRSRGPSSAAGPRESGIAKAMKKVGLTKW